MERRCGYLAILVFLAISALLPHSASAEIIIVNDTRPSFWAVSEMRLSGDLDANKLSIAGSGEVISGEDVKVYLIGRASDILIDHVIVNGKEVTVSFDDKGYFMVLGKGRFDYQGDLTLRTAGQARLYVPGPVNAVKFDIKHGYAVHGDQYGLYGSDIIIQRAEKVAMLADGSFKYTFAERNSFDYRLNFRSFGSSLGRAVLNLRSGESIVSVTGAKDYSIDGGKLLLELSGESASVIVTGTFMGSDIRVPLDEGRHHVLIESDPQKKLSISTSAEEIDLSQSSISPSYSNARAFLAGGGDAISVSVVTLQMYPSLAASVSQATNRIAITEKGSMLGELEYRYSNTGVDYIGMDVPGVPLYAATGYRSSIKLTKDEGKLFLSFPKTQSGTLDLIYFNTTSQLGAVNMIDVPVANTDLTITDFTTQVILPSDYVVLWTYGAKGGSELPGLESIMVFMIIFGGLGYMLRPRVSFAAAYLVFSIGAYYFSYVVLAMAVIATLILAVKRHVSAQSMKWMLAGAGMLIVLCLGVVVFFGIMSMGIFNMGSTSYEKNAMVSSDYAMVEEAAPRQVMSKSMNLIGAGEGALNVPVREGVLPVRLELPALGKTITVTSHLVHKDDPMRITILVVAGWLKYLMYAASIAAGVACARMYRGAASA